MNVTEVLVINDSIMHLSSYLLQAELRARGTRAERQKRNKNSIGKKSSGIVLTPLPSVRLSGHPIDRANWQHQGPPDQAFVSVGWN